MSPSIYQYVINLFLSPPVSRSALGHRLRLVNSPKNHRVRLGISWF